MNSSRISVTNDAVCGMQIQIACPNGSTYSWRIEGQYVILLINNCKVCAFQSDPDNVVWALSLGVSNIKLLSGWANGAVQVKRARVMPNAQVRVTTNNGRDTTSVNIISAVEASAL